MKNRITWELLKQIDDSQFKGHYDNANTTWNRNKTRRVPRWVSDKMKAPSLKHLSDFINTDIIMQAKGFKAELDHTTISKGRQMSSGVYYTRGTYTGNKLTVCVNGQQVYEHNSAETYRSNSDVVSWILRQK